MEILVFSKVIYAKVISIDFGDFGEMRYPSKITDITYNVIIYSRMLSFMGVYNIID